MKRSIARLLVVIVAALSLPTAFGGTAFAQSGHFVGTPTCTDEGTTAECRGKVAGLGGTTFEITVTAPGTATVECTNPGGNVTPGQTFTTTVAGSSGPLATPRNGQFRFTVETVTPTAPPGSCPNPQWTAEVVDVEFGDTTITHRGWRGLGHGHRSGHHLTSPRPTPQGGSSPGHRGCSRSDPGTTAEPVDHHPPAVRMF